MLRSEWKDSLAAGPIDDEPVARFAQADAQLAARETELREADARTRREALGRLQQLLGRVEGLAAKTDLTLKAADRALRDLRGALGAMPPLPTKQDHEQVLQRLKAAQGLLTTKAQELREADEWQRWANAGIQEQLCARMEALATVEDPEAVAREVHELQQQWRQAADVPRAQADALWRRFKTAHDVVWARCEKHFAEQAQVRAENLAKKVTLCERAEALAESTNWIQTAEELKQLQAEWKTIGPVSRGREKAIWDRFRTACDRFFTRRHEDLTQRKALWTTNLTRKEELCVRAEALAESRDWEPALAEIKQLQADWKTIGPVKKTKSEAIWQRFRGACDRFFAAYAQRHEVVRAERVAAREAICAELEALAAAPADAETPLVAALRSLRTRWQQEIAARGVDSDRARALDQRFAAAFAAVQAAQATALAGTELDPDTNRKQMESLVRKVEDLAAGLTGPQDEAADAGLSSATRLAAMLKEALAANTIGGKAADETRLRAAADDLRQAQTAWARLGPVPDEIRRGLTDCFNRASKRVADRTVAARPRDSRPAPPPRSSQPGRPGPGPKGPSGPVRTPAAAPRSSADSGGQG